MNQPAIVLICLGVVVGMWLERYEIVVTSLHRPHLPSAWGIYHGTFWDWATLLGTVGMFLSGILLSVRYVPIVSMHEMRSLIAKKRAISFRAARMKGVLAGFTSERALNRAVERLVAEKLKNIETYTPKPLNEEAEPTGSPLPLAMFIAGMLGFVGFLLLMTYADVRAYPLDIGGRPQFAWPAFIPIAFELGVLCAMGAGFFGYFWLCRLPKLYDPVDDCDSFETHRAMAGSSRCAPPMMSLESGTVAPRVARAVRVSRSSPNERAATARARMRACYCSPVAMTW